MFGQRFNRADRELRRLIGIGTQDLSIYPDLSARENLRFFGKLYGLGGKDLEARIEDVLARGWPHRSRQRPRRDILRRHEAAAQPRGGDRPFAEAALPRRADDGRRSAESRNHIFQQVQALNAAGMTVIYTSHYMEEVQSLCPRIAILDNGRLLACDTLPNLLKRLDGRVRFDA